MIFDRNEKKEVIALLGAGSMGTAIVISRWWMHPLLSVAEPQMRSPRQVHSCWGNMLGLLQEQIS